ncbi:MAG: glyceraldehyde-3-phosphate dehydrogenase, partial [Deltaproteobacteria bacterium]|nr:glyceraldehyde-3-phosphate dehydrogenase [Deltaproteobacteria bacterium]
MNGSSADISYEGILKQWTDDVKAANAFIDIVHRLWYDKSIELILYRRQLIDRGASSVLSKHSYAQNIIHTPLTIHDSLRLAQAM